MRERTAIEREIFHARQDLEATLGRLVHKVREQVAIPTRVGHAIRTAVRGNRVWIAAAVALFGAALLLIRRVRR